VFALYDRMIKERPDEILAHTFSTAARRRSRMIYERQGKKDIARSEYQTALSINPKNAEAKKMLDALK